MKLMISILLLCIVSMCLGQPQSEEFIYGSASYDVLEAVTGLPDGSFILVGTSPPDGDNWQDVYVEKLTPDATATEWTVTFGGTRWDEPYDVIPALDDGYLVVGGTRTGPSSTFEMFARKITANGFLDWQVEYGELGNDAAFRAFGHDGGYTLLGYSRPDKFEQSDYRMLRINAQGVEQWHLDFGGDKDEMMMAADQATDNSFLIAGYTQSWESLDMDMYLLHIAADGTILHEVYEVEQYPNVPYAVEAVEDGFIVAGSVFRNPETEMPSPFLLKLDFDGSIVWRQEYLNGHYAEPRDIARTENGFVLAGFAQVNGLPDGWVMWTDAQGNLIEEAIFGDDGWDEFKSIEPLGESGSIVVGFSSSTGTTNRTTDFYRVHVGDSLVNHEGTPTFVTSYRLSNAWPNPFNSATQLSFQCPRSVSLRIMLYDLLGREILKVTDSRVFAGEHNFLLSADGLASGMYMVRAYANGQPVDERRVVLLK